MCGECWEGELCKDKAQERIKDVTLEDVQSRVRDRRKKATEKGIYNVQREEEGKDELEGRVGG